MPTDNGKSIIINFFNKFPNYHITDIHYVRHASVYALTVNIDDVFHHTTAFDVITEIDFRTNTIRGIIDPENPRLHR